MYVFEHTHSILTLEFSALEIKPAVYVFYFDHLKQLTSHYFHYLYILHTVASYDNTAPLFIM